MGDVQKINFGKIPGVPNSNHGFCYKAVIAVGAPIVQRIEPPSPKGVIRVRVAVGALIHYSA